MLKSIKYTILLFALSMLLTSAKAHKYYVSVTNVTYVKKEQSLQIISQVFIDDFENLLRKRYDQNITLTTKNEAKQVEGYMQRYYQDKLKINVNGKPLEFKFLGKEYEDDMVYTYLEIKNVPQIQAITITNQLLFDVFTDQQNITKLNVNGKKKSFMLFKTQDSCVLNFN